MKHTILLHLLIVALFAFAYSQTTTTTYTESDVFVQDLKLFVKGQEFFIKAMAYEPVPLGIMNVSDDGWGGTGFCSAKKTVFAEYKSACHGSDFIDASTDYRRVPKGPASSTGALLPWWQQVWQRDLPKIKELGANTIRIYNMNPITKKFLTMYPNAISGIKDSSVAADHKPFLDYAHSMGFKVILPIVQDRDLLLESSSELLDQMITAAVTDLGDHPALLMWCLGNEVDIPQNTQLMDIINDKMDVVRQKMKQIHNRVVPVTSAVIDIPKNYETLAANLKVDVFTTNAGYRDTVMDPLWDGETVDGYEFRGWTALSKAVNKPLFIGEIGMHQVNNQINMDRPDWFNQQWQQIVNHIDNGCVGACFFEYSDEPQKPLEQQTMGVVSLSVAKSGSKSSTDANAWIPDNVNEKNIYAALKTGLDGSAVKKYNMNANVFTLINRQPATVDVQAEPSTGKSTGQEESDPNQQPDDSSGGSNIKSGAFWIGSFVALAVMMFFNSFFKN